MEWLNRLNAVIVYLEEHLEDGIDLTRMAQIACCSPFHFQRMFSYLAEVVTSSMKGKDFDYYIAAPSDMAVPEGLVEYTVPSCTWAIFTCVGPMPTAIQALQKRIISEWLPSSGYEYADAPFQI
jgi:predicted transcriptional regulator YdeE